MTISFSEKRNRLKQLSLILAAIIFIGIIVIFVPKIFPKIEPVILPEIEIPVEKIEIGFHVLGHPLFEELRPFPEIKALEEEIGRENPFLSY